MFRVINNMMNVFKMWGILGLALDYDICEVFVMTKCAQNNLYGS